jgi:phage protein D
MSTYQVLFDGQPAAQDFYDVVGALEVEENADLPDAVSFQLPVAADSGDLTWVSDPRVQPYANVALTVTPDGGGAAQCIFDGYVLSHKVHLLAGVTAATVTVWGQDASVLMGLQEKTREWSGLTDGEVANQIFDAYGIAAAPANTDGDMLRHNDDEHTLMQRGSDIDFLRRLARRTGRWCRVSCAGTAGQRTGFFASPALGGDPAVTIDLNDPAKSQVPALDFSWDVARPTTVNARQASLTDPDPEGVSADTSDSGLPARNPRALRDFAGRDTAVLLTATADTAELASRARGVLGEAGWFACCEGTADLAVLKMIPRVGMVVAVEGVGELFSGFYLVWRVRHTISRQAHTMALTLRGNSIGAGAAAGGGGLGGLL